MPEGRTKRPTTGRPVPPRSTQVVLSGSTMTVRESPVPTLPLNRSSVKKRLTESSAGITCSNVKWPRASVMSCWLCVIGMASSGAQRLVALREKHQDPRGWPRADFHGPLDPTPGMNRQLRRPGQRLFVRLGKASSVVDEDAEWLGLGWEAESAIGAGDDLGIGRLVELAVVELGAQ